jgi:hypothetical protein
MGFISKSYPWASITMLIAFFGYSILFPAYIYLERDGWIWIAPGRNFAIEHMLVNNYFILGLFFLWGARDPIKYLPITDLTIVTNICHATVMLFDALSYPNHLAHLAPGGDVPGTYLAPIVLLLGHPLRFYIPWLRARTP